MGLLVSRAWPVSSTTRSGRRHHPSPGRISLVAAVELQLAAGHFHQKDAL
jgi:hypothetical protein